MRTPMSLLAVGLLVLQFLVWPAAAAENYVPLPVWVTGVWSRLTPVVSRAGLRPPPPVFLSSNPYPNAVYHGDWIEVTSGLLTLIGEVPGELAFVLAHEAGHGLHQKNPKGTLVLHDFLQTLYKIRNPLKKRGQVTKKESETLADLWGFCLLSAAGYNFNDAYAFFGRLQGSKGTAWDRAARQGVLGGEMEIWLKDVHSGDAHRISYLHRAAEKGLPQQCAKAYQTP